jgi:hypothetical protein
MRKKTSKTGKPTQVIYQGNDPAPYIWSSKTHRSASEAFRDADYATPIWRQKGELEDFTEWCKDSMVVIPFLFVLVAAIYYAFPYFK